MQPRYYKYSRIKVHLLFNFTLMLRSSQPSSGITF